MELGHSLELKSFRVFVKKFGRNSEFKKGKERFKIILFSVPLPLSAYLFFVLVIRTKNYCFSLFIFLDIFLSITANRVARSRSGSKRPVERSRRRWQIMLMFRCTDVNVNVQRWFGGGRRKEGVAAVWVRWRGLVSWSWTRRGL